MLVTISDKKLQVTGNGGSESNGECEAGTGKDILDVDERTNEPSYVAQTEVNLIPGFDNEVGDDYSAYIDATLADCIEYTTPPVSTEGWYYAAEIISANDYAPFGMGLVNRKWNSSSYRYGFGGQEKSDEIKGEGNSYTAEFWEYDSRLGRRWNVDPIVKEYESPYAAFGNNPIWNIDPNGADTSKYLSSKQTVDAIKIGYNVIKKRLDTKTFSPGGDYSKEIEVGITDYWKNNQDSYSFGAAAEFRQQTYEYVKGLREVASALDGANLFNGLGTKILYNKSVSNYSTV